MMAEVPTAGDAGGVAQDTGTGGGTRTPAQSPSADVAYDRLHGLDGHTQADPDEMARAYMAKADRLEGELDMALRMHNALVARVRAALTPVDETWGGAAMVVRDRVRVAIQPPRPRTSDHTETADEFLARTRPIPPACAQSAPTPATASPMTK